MKVLILSKKEQDLLVRILKFNQEILTDELANLEINNESTEHNRTDMKVTEGLLNKLK